jgi:hypothetical protein
VTVWIGVNNSALATCSGTGCAGSPLWYPGNCAVDNANGYQYTQLYNYTIRIGIGLDQLAILCELCSL